MSWHDGFRTVPPKYRPVAVVDIGSNSVRLVVYDGLRRSPSPIFNEKVLCGLGKGVAISGRLHKDGMARALLALRRFRALASQMRVSDVFAVATAAAREAANGPDFIKAAEKSLGTKIRVLTGKEEARFAAMGVIAAIPEADGLVGDLGGGSLELIDIKDEKLRGGITLPIGPLRLIDLSGGLMDRAEKIVDEHLARAPVLKQLKGRKFYAVGGAWRNLARMHMAEAHYPLHVLHYYEIPRREAEELSHLVTRPAEDVLEEIRDIAKARVDTLPFAAMVMARLMRVGEPKALITSVYGVREGLLYSKLPGKKSKQDALLASCWDFARRYARSPAHELELCDWTDQLFGKKGLEESSDERRLRHAACMLADIGWRAHPDYRAERSLGMISQAAFVGVDHPGRVFLALTIFYRYDGEAMAEEMTKLVSQKQIERAHLLSNMFRLAYILSAAMPGLLPRIGLKIKGKTLELTLPDKLKDLMGERVEKRLADLAFEMELAPKIAIGK